jgi:hypothetical protein
MAISRPFLLALLGVVLLGASALAVQNARDSADSDATPAAVQSEPAPAPTPTNTAAADTLKAAFNLDALKSARFAARLGVSDRSQSMRVQLGGAFERGAAREMPRFELHGHLRIGGQQIVGGFVSLGDKAYFTRGDSGWRLPAAVWDPITKAVASGQTQQAPGLDLHPESWLRDVKSEGKATVGGVETEHLSGRVDPQALLVDLDQAVPVGGARALRRGRAADAVKRADFDVWVGADDHIMRRASGTLVVAGAGRIDLDLRLSDVNKPQQIEAPKDVRPGAPDGAFGAFAEGLVGGVSGGNVSLKAMTSPNPGRAARAVRKHQKVVILFRNSRGLDDRAMAAVMRSVDQRTKALVLTDDVAAVERYGKLVEDVGVSQTPSIMIIDRSGRARLIEGYVDSDTLTQAVSDAR